MDTNSGNYANNFDYSFVNSIARIATYDDLSSAPRVTEITPAPTDQFIMSLATTTYEQAKMLGGEIPFSIIKEVSENFIHARFAEITISILDGGNTIRFADQGPGIEDKEKVQHPGYTSANEEMKKYIRGVGSGLPLVEDYLNAKDGSVTIDDNVYHGAVITISLTIHDDEKEPTDPFNIPEIPSINNPQNLAMGGMPYQRPVAQPYQQQVPQQPNQQQVPPAAQACPSASMSAQSYAPASGFGGYTELAQQSIYANNDAYDYMNQIRDARLSDRNPNNMHMVGNNNRVPMYVPQVPTLTERAKLCLTVLLSEGPLGVTEIASFTGIPASSTYNELKKLEEGGLIIKGAGQKRVLTNIGYTVASALQ